jgi:hypothetical protein
MMIRTKEHGSQMTLTWFAQEFSSLSIVLVGLSIA